MIRAILVLVLLLLFHSPSAGAWEADASLGNCRYQHAAEWIWWSPQFGFSGEMNTSCTEVGISWPVSDRNGFRLGYINGGGFSSDNLALWGVDGQTYDPAKPCNVKEQKNCLAEYKGRGGMYGGTVGFWRTYDSGAVRIRPEIGALFYHSWFNVDATPINQDTGKTMEWHRWDHASGTHYTQYLAVTTSYKNIGFRLEWFRKVHESQRGDPTFFGVTEGPVRRVAIVYTF